MHKFQDIHFNHETVCYRTAVTDLDFFSQTEIEQQWGKNPGLCDKAKSLYTQIPVKKFPCFLDKKLKKDKNKNSNASVTDESETFTHSPNDYEMNELSPMDVEEVYSYLVSGII